MKFGTPPPQDVIFGKKYFGGGGCDQRHISLNLLKNNKYITPTCGKVGVF